MRIKMHAAKVYNTDQMCESMGKYTDVWRKDSDLGATLACYLAYLYTLRGITGS